MKKYIKNVKELQRESMKKVNKKKKIVIIGGGVSGLSSGIYALQNGFDAVIYEKHSVLGGLCSSWNRYGFHIDGCVHWLTGTQEHTDLYKMWQDLGVITCSDDIVYHQNAGVFKVLDKEFTLYCDINKFEQELLSLAPEDKKQIKKLCNNLVTIMNLPLPLNEPINTMSLKRLTKVGLSILPFLSFYSKISHTSCEQYAKKFKSPYMKHLITRFQSGPGSLYQTLYSLATIIFNNGGVPTHGSKGLVDKLVNKFVSLGGQYYVNQGAKKFNINKKGICESLLLENGSLIYADYFISAVDARILLDKLLEGKYVDKKLEKRYKNPVKFPIVSCFGCYFALDKELVKKVFNGSHRYFVSVEPFKVGLRTVDQIIVRNFSFDSYFDHNNKTVLEIEFDQYYDHYEFWESIYNDKEKYNAVKKDICNTILSRLVAVYPELKIEDFQYLDSYSPCTLNRYTGAYKGSFMSFLFTHDNKILFHSGNICHIKNLYFASQWSQSPGGLPLAAAVGKFSIQRILKKEKMKYLFNKPLFHKYSR